MRAALHRLGAPRDKTVVIGDRMDTDVVAGIESEIRTVLLLSGVTSTSDLPLFSYRPDFVLSSIGDIVADVVPMSPEVHS